MQQQYPICVKQKIFNFQGYFLKSEEKERVVFAKQGLTTFASQITAPTWIISATRASASFVHCTVGENLIREGPSWIILTIAHRVQTTKKPSPDPQEEKQLTMVI